MDCIDAKTGFGGVIIKPIENFLTAIVEDDQAAAKKLLARDSTLATRIFTQPELYRSKILHWIYAGDTVLHLAAAGHRLEIVRLLIAAGGGVNIAGKHRHATPLHYAADGCVGSPDWDPKQQVKTIQVLLKSGANINAQDKNGATPLHRAVRTRCSAAVKTLLESGADAMLKNKPGSTPFHLAVQNTGRGGSGEDIAITEQKQIIKEFLSFGISPNLRTASGKTVRDCAQSEWIREMLAKS